MRQHATDAGGGIRFGRNRLRITIRETTPTSTPRISLDDNTAARYKPGRKAVNRKAVSQKVSQHVTQQQTAAKAGDDGEPRIRVRGLGKHYGALEVFKNINFDVGKREIVAIVGPSGCGKTTLLRCIDGLLPHDVGEILVGDTRVTEPIAGVAMVFQHFGLFPWKTVSENVAYGLRMAGAPKAEIARKVPEFVKLVGLAGFENAFPYQMSGGMQQRCGLARALADEPHGQKNKTDRDQRLADPPQDLPPQKLEHQQTDKKEQAGKPLEVECQNLDSNGRAGMGRQQDQNDPPHRDFPAFRQVHRRQRKTGRGRDHHPGSKPAEDRLVGLFRRARKPPHHPVAEQPVHPLAEKSGTKNRERYAADDLEISHGS